MSDKEIRADAKLKNLHEEALQELWRFRNPEEGGEKLTLEAICVEVPLRYGFTVSLSTLSDFYAWLRLKRRLDARATLADQLKLELAKNPDVSEEQIKKAGQRLFMAEGIIEKDSKVFADMVKIGQADTKLQQNDKRLKQTDKVIDQNNRRIKLLEEAAAEAKAKLLALTSAAKSQGGLSPETLKQIEEAAGLL
jgi:hypothetical protein